MTTPPMVAPTVPPHVVPGGKRTEYDSLLGKPAFAFGLCPTVIPADKKYTVPKGWQLLYAIAIDVQGTLDVQGDLVLVD